MSRPRKEHVVEQRWHTGGFDVIRYIKCRCGWTARDRFTQRLAEKFKEHAEAPTPPVLPPVVPDSEPQPLDWEHQPEFRAACDIEPLIFGEDHEASDEDWDLLRRIVQEVRSSDAGANGYVVVPRHLLDELRAALLGPGWWPLSRAAAAVVEAVGPTTPQTFRITQGQRQYLAETVKRDRRRGPTT